MTAKTSAKTLAALLRPSSEIRPIVLIGAGASFRSGIPMAAESVKRIARRAYARTELGGKTQLSQLKLTEWLPWLMKKDWFIPGEENLADNFPLVVEHLLQPAEFRREVLLELAEPTNPVSHGYSVLADFMLRGLVWTILTTNFDRCLPIAFDARKPHLRHVAEVNRSKDDLAEFNIQNRRQLVWLHGRAEKYTDRNSIQEIHHLDPSLLARLRPLIDDSPLIVIGYRGAEPSVVEDLLMGGLQSSQKFRHGIFWCVRGNDSVHENVHRLADSIGSNFQFLKIDGFDELMTELAEELQGEDSYAGKNPVIAGLPLPQSFDEQSNQECKLVDLDDDLMLTTLGVYCRNLKRAPVTKDSLPALLRELGLLHTIDGSDIPTNACCLLFAKQLPRSLEHAVVAVTRGHKNRTLITGNLLEQQRRLIEVLDSQDFNPVLKVKGQRAYQERTAYPSRVLTELVVNILVHRDYQRPETAHINLEPGRALSFENPAQVGKDFLTRWEVDHQGKFKPRRTVSEVRNPSIADVFFGVNAMEKAGSGLADVEDVMREHGGDSHFEVNVRAALFKVTVRQPIQASPERTDVARPLGSSGQYIINYLPFEVLPDSLTRASLIPGAAKTLFTQKVVDLPILVVAADEVWTFAPPSEVSKQLGDRLKSEPVVVSRAVVESSADTRNILSWLLGKHWDFYLREFRQDGLFVESKKKRAYFQRRNGASSVIVYDGLKRRGIRREVVKSRSDGKWHENEGVGYHIVFNDGDWAIRLKPFYMFTGRDGAKPLPGFERSKRSTQRIKFDRNRNVDDDLTFWSRYLSKCNATINIGGKDCQGLIVGASFLMIEVIESEDLSEAANENSN